MIDEDSIGAIVSEAISYEGVAEAKEFKRIELIHRAETLLKKECDRSFEDGYLAAREARDERRWSIR